jgi:ATP-dependent DNA ligase I
MDPSQTTSDGSSARFQRLGETAERIKATTKRNEKADLLGAFLVTLNDDDLVIAARYFAGYCFPLRDQRTTNVGGSALFSALSAVTGIDDDVLSATLVRRGDFGDAAEEVYRSLTERVAESLLTIRDVAAAIDDLANTSGAKRKLEALKSLLKGRTPLEAKYMVKLLAGDLRIGLKEGAVEDAVARTFDVPADRLRWANMLTGDIGETALLARRRQLETARMRLFHPIRFMLATPAADLSEVAKQMPPEFAVEDKYDGIRAQAHVAPAAEDDDPAIHGIVNGGVRVAIFSRTLDEITQSFPDLIGPLSSLIKDRIQTAPHHGPAGLMLDGEIVPCRDDRILPFNELQKRLGRKKLSAEMLAAVPVSFFVYDVLYHDGKVMVGESFDRRRSAIDSLHPRDAGVRLAPSKRFVDAESLDAEFSAARERGNEGLMVKDPGSSYTPGRRGREWLKIKRALATLDVVVTAVERGNGRRHNVLSDYTFAVRASESDPALLNIGKAYSGLTDAEIAEMSEWFIAHTVQEYAHGKVRTVEPEVVIEVTFDRVQPSKRHKSGYALRFPRILRIRRDKPAEEIDTLDTVRRLAELSAQS